jgi:hypothetical protein
MKTMVITLFSVLLVVGVVNMPSHAAKSLGGTIELVDPASLTITIMTDTGQTASLPVVNESLLAGLAHGDRVFCEMNEDGKVTKIVKATPIPNGFPAPEPKG